MSNEQTRRLREAVLPTAVLALVLLGWLDMFQHYALGGAAALILSLARAVPLLWYRTHPLLAWGVSLAAIVLTAVVAHPVSAAEPWPWPVTSQAVNLAMLVLAGSRVPRRTSAAMGVAVVSVTAALLALVPGRGSWSGVLLVGVAATLALITAEVLRDREQTRTRLVEQERISETERTRRALLEERSRIGRELHDVVAHHMSLIAVRAETAPYRLPDSSAEVRQEFRAVSAAAREALVDMRRLLGLLRGDQAAERMPQPDLAQLPDLVKEAGSSAELEVVGDLGSVPETVGVCAYRIVQESLSNARRHAVGAPVSVRVRRGALALEIAVDNGPHAAEPAAALPGAAGAGHGLMGMRERVALLGGEFSARTTPEGGFSVTARLPLPEER